jgi:hypothetical protein
MKYLLVLFVGVILAACGTQIAYTNAIKEEFGLDSVKKIKNVQFILSTEIQLTRSSTSGNQGTDEAGVLVTNSSKDEEVVILKMGTYGKFDSFGEDGEIIVRFEIGPGKFLTFATREGQEAGKYFFVADWKAEPGKGGKIEYGNETYYAKANAGKCYLMVLKKNLNKTKRKERVVKGLKV